MAVARGQAWFAAASTRPPVAVFHTPTVQLIKGIITGSGWEDFGVLMVLQFANAIIGFIEEHNAGNAIAALKQQLAPQTFACR